MSSGFAIGRGARERTLCISNVAEQALQLGIQRSWTRPSWKLVGSRLLPDKRRLSDSSVMCEARQGERFRFIAKNRDGAEDAYTLARCGAMYWSEDGSAMCFPARSCDKGPAQPRSRGWSRSRPKTPDEHPRMNTSRPLCPISTLKISVGDVCISISCPTKHHARRWVAFDPVIDFAYGLDRGLPRWSPVEAALLLLWS